MTVTVTITSDDIIYSPSNIVKHGEEVEFKLHGVASAQVVFKDGTTCLSGSSSFVLDTSSPLAQESDQHVTQTCLKRVYPFDVVIPAPPPSQQAKSFIGSNAETKKGGLDVTTDPPEEPKK
ncbi:hypothetical protein LXT21_34680 [Myxococcus sp. K38C18041901]|uniref:hypothetical protein n=1 Tax=Myxococcus guangdongensis TaxID=2906760 RepID=UPI0020A80585|nr:hypothetical protein [Myxococcus guangdongensis]MCP3063936.1 hypothetical protein [Myxococcus guangdongensis]